MLQQNAEAIDATAGNPGEAPGVDGGTEWRGARPARPSSDPENAKGSSADGLCN
jgi:hypothetical protein